MRGGETWQLIEEPEKAFLMLGNSQGPETKTAPGERSVPTRENPGRKEADLVLYGVY